MASLQTGGRLEILRDRELPLSVRAVAAWYGSGLQWFADRRMCGGDLDALLERYRALGAPDALMAAVGLAARRTREPLVVLMPLIALAAQQSKLQTQSEISLFPPTAEVEGIPLYAFDMHTRLGRQALEQFWIEEPCMRAAVTRYVRDRSGRDAVRVAAFHAEAALIGPRFVWEHARKIEALGIETDLLSAGVLREGHAAMLDAVRRNLDHLNELRKRAYRRSGARLCR